MTPDHLALAKDVDRLFRARRDGEVAPVGEFVQVGKKDRRKPGLWYPCAEELLAHSTLYCVMQDCHDDPVFGAQEGPWPALRCRKHVAMLALTSPDFLRERVDGIQQARIAEARFASKTLERHFPKTRTPLRTLSLFTGLPEDFVVRWMTEAANGRPRPEIPVKASEPKPADVARTGAFLAELQERLRLWRERDDARRVNEAIQRQAIKDARIARITEARIEVDGDVLAAMATSI